MGPEAAEPQGIRPALATRIWMASELSAAECGEALGPAAGPESNLPKEVESLASGGDGHLDVAVRRQHAVAGTCPNHVLSGLGKRDGRLRFVVFDR